MKTKSNCIIPPNTSMATLTLAAAALLALTCTPVHAGIDFGEDLSLTNRSFENGNFVNLGGGYDFLDPGSTDISGWTVIDHTIAWGRVPNETGIQAADGAHFLDLSGDGAGPLGGITQNISTTIGQRYNFSIALATINVPVTVQVDAGDTSMQFTQSDNQHWGTFRFPFLATDSVTPVTITGISGDTTVLLDSPVITEIASTPEPATWAVGLLCLAVGIGARRRRQNV